MTLLLDQLDLLSTPPDHPAGIPLRISLDAIDEDPEQPRMEFDADKLSELAASIALSGVLQPISVRRHPQLEARWILNFGARRFRASRMVGKDDVPAYVDNTPDDYAQVVENEQRDGLKPLELALFVQRRLALGESQAEIARRMGKSRTYVTMAAAMIDAPDWLLAAYREGRCRGLSELYELRRLAGDHPERVQAWTTSQQPISRGSIAALRADLTGNMSSPGHPPAAAAQAPVYPSVPAPSDALATDEALPTSAESNLRLRRKPLLMATLDGVAVVVDTLAVPPTAGQLFVREVGGRSPELVEASRLTLTGLVVA